MKAREARNARKAREARYAKKSMKEATEKQDDKGASLYAEISFSQEDQLSRRMPAIPHGSNLFLVKSTAYQDMLDEDRKESLQSEDRFIRQSEDYSMD